jgi:predicted nucleotide-binding protein
MVMSLYYLDENEEEEVFRVFISHGRSDLWRQVERYINKSLDMDTVVLKEQYRGATIIEKLEDEADECDCAVVIMTPDDKMADGSFRSRQNVVHEIGYLQALYGREHVVILKEESVEFFSNNSGIEYIPFTGALVSSTLHTLNEALTAIYEEFCVDDDDEEEQE